MVGGMGVCENLYWKRHEWSGILKMERKRCAAQNTGRGAGLGKKCVLGWSGPALSG